MRPLWLIVLAGCLANCGGESRPPLEVSDINVFAPLPGTAMSVAYMAFENTTDEAIVVAGFSSPQFGRIELHETQIVDGVVRMRPLANLSIPPGGTAVLEENHKHLMLMQPADALSIDDPVSLRIAYDNDGMLIVNATLRPRIELER